MDSRGFVGLFDFKRAVREMRVIEENFLFDLNCYLKYKTSLQLHRFYIINPFMLSNRLLVL